MSLRKIAKKIVLGEGQKVFIVDAEVTIEVSYSNIYGMKFDLDFFGAKKLSVLDMDNADLPKHVYDKFLNGLEGRESIVISISEAEVYADTEAEARELFITEISKKDNWNPQFTLNDRDRSIDVGSQIEDIRDVNIYSIKEEE